MEFANLITSLSQSIAPGAWLQGDALRQATEGLLTDAFDGTLWGGFDYQGLQRATEESSEPGTTASSTKVSRSITG